MTSRRAVVSFLLLALVAGACRKRPRSIAKPERNAGAQAAGGRPAKTSSTPEPEKPPEKEEPDGEATGPAVVKVHPPVPEKVEVTGEFAEMIARVEELENDARFTEALTLSRKLQSKFRGHEGYPALRELARRITGERQEAMRSNLAFATRELGSDSRDVVEVARGTLTSAGETGRIFLRKAVRKAEGRAVVEAAAALAELRDGRVAELAVERILREGDPAVRDGLLRTIEPAAGGLDLELTGRLLSYAGSADGARHAEAIAGMAKRRARGELDPEGLGALYGRARGDEAFAEKGIVDFFADIYFRKCRRRTDEFNALFPDRAERLAFLRAYAERAKASRDEALAEWGWRAKNAFSAHDPGLVLWLTFDDAPGARAADKSSKNHHGKLIGTPTREKGFVGTGSVGCRTGYIQLPDIRSEFSNEATLSLWVKMDSHKPPTDQNGVFNFGTSPDNTHYIWPDGKFWLKPFRDDRLSFVAPATPDRATWHHMAITNAPGANNWKVYLNATEVHSNTGEDKITLPANCRIGYSVSGYAYGNFDDVRVYNRALSAAEVAALYREFRE